jgi:hypothetical protein
MKSASQLSQLIRAKKKKMQEDPDVIDSAGSPSMDAQDIDHAKRLEATDELNENIPVEHDQANEQSPADEMDDEKSMKKKMRIRGMLSAK